jgi:hypothetical protein
LPFLAIPSARLEAEDFTEPPTFIFNGRLPGTFSVINWIHTATTTAPHQGRGYLPRFVHFAKESASFPPHNFGGCSNERSSNALATLFFRRHA